MSGTADGDATGTRGPVAWLYGAMLLVAAGLIAIPWAAHVDDIDGQLYLVVARNLAEDRAWLSLRFVPGVYSPFHEHLPFGFWPAALAIRLLGEGAVAPLYALFGLATVALVAWTARRLAGDAAGLVAGLSLALVEGFWRYAGRLWLDPPLYLLTTASVAVLLVRENPRRRDYAAAALLAGLAGLIKGPFGLIPLAAVLGARALVTPSWRAFLAPVVLLPLAATPFLAFLLGNRLFGDGAWWDHYLLGQLLASATGARRDGIFSRWLPFEVILNRFWPGLALVLVGVVRAALPVRWRRTPLDAAGVAQRRTLRLLVWTAGLGLAALCLPQRKLPHHVLVVYPLLAVLAGAAVGPWLGAILRGRARVLRVAAGLAVAAVLLAWIPRNPTVLRKTTKPPCVVAAEFAPALDALPAHAPILVVSTKSERGALVYEMVQRLAAERRLIPFGMTALPAPDAQPLPGGADAKMAVVDALAYEQLPEPWRPVTVARGWVLAVRP